MMAGTLPKRYEKEKQMNKQFTNSLELYRILHNQSAKQNQLLYCPTPMSCSGIRSVKERFND